jgi:nucleoid-associated protein YgaU
MKVIRIIITAALVAAVVAPALLFAQNFLQENEHYQRAQELQRQAQEALDEGEYDRAMELSRQAREQAQQARAYAENQVLVYRANSWKNRAKKRIDYVKTMDAEERYPDKFSAAQQAYERAVQLFEEESYQDSIHASQEAINTLVAVEPRDDVKPKYYTVQKRSTKTDCLWRIAGYDFVYGDPWKWKELYRANKEKLPDPDNPSWIEPGIVLEIPSISGEERSGMYEPE